MSDEIEVRRNNSLMTEIDRQTEAYNHLDYQHHSTRRENQRILIEPLENLKLNVAQCLEDDRAKYQRAKGEYRSNYSFFERLLTSDASRYHKSSVDPLKSLYERRVLLMKKIDGLHEAITQELNPMEFRSEWNGSIAVVFNPESGRAEWRTYRSGGIHGVYDPIKKSVEWETSFHTGVYGVFNPQLNIVEWKRFYKGGVHGVYNPAKKIVEWFTSFNSGVGGVFNPLTEQVEWKTSFKGSVIGYFDRNTQVVNWIEKWHHGLAMILWDPDKQSYSTTSSCGWFNDDD